MKINFLVVSFVLFACLPCCGDEGLGWNPTPGKYSGMDHRSVYNSDNSLHDEGVNINAEFDINEDLWLENISFDFVCEEWDSEGNNSYYYFKTGTVTGRESFHRLEADKESGNYRTTIVSDNEDWEIIVTIESENTAFACIFINWESMIGESLESGISECTCCNEKIILVENTSDQEL